MHDKDAARAVLEEVRQRQHVKGGLEVVVQLQAELRVKGARGRVFVRRRRGVGVRRVLVKHLGEEAAHDVLPAALVVAAVEHARAARARAGLAGVEERKGGEDEDDFARAVAAVDKVAVDEVAVGRAGHAVERKHGEEVLQLAVRVAAHGQPRARLHRGFDERGQRRRVRVERAQQAHGVLVVQDGAALAGVQQRHDLRQRQRELNVRAVVARRHGQRLGLGRPRLQPARLGPLARHARAQRRLHQPLPPQQHAVLVVGVQRRKRAPRHLGARLLLRQRHAQRRRHHRARLGLGVVRRQVLAAHKRRALARRRKVAPAQHRALVLADFALQLQAVPLLGRRRARRRGARVGGKGARLRKSCDARRRPTHSALGEISRSAVLNHGAVLAVDEHQRAHRQRRHRARGFFRRLAREKKRPSEKKGRTRRCGSARPALDAASG